MPTLRGRWGLRLAPIPLEKALWAQRRRRVGRHWGHDTITVAHDETRGNVLLAPRTPIVGRAAYAVEDSREAFGVA